jgi:hypothetical protein
VSKKVAVISFLWGEWPEDNPRLGAEYVRKLHSSVLRNTLTPFDWVNFGNLINSRAIPSEFSQYRWNLKKMFMFSEEAGLKGYEWVVALDLDLIVTGSLDFILKCRSTDLLTCRGAYLNQNPGGSVVAFDPNQQWTTEIAEYLRRNKKAVEELTRGSERKFYHILKDLGWLNIRYWQDLYPNTVLSYKVDGYQPGASIVRFHGKPRPHQVNEQWIKENWR